jgi:putative flippase GtrA
MDRPVPDSPRWTRPGLTRLAGEGFRFGFVGLVATLVHLAVGLLTLRAGAEPLVANTFGFLSAVSISVVGHHWLTFASAAPFRRTAPRFALIALLGFLFNSVVLALLVGLLPPGFEAPALAAAVLLTPIVTFIAARLFAYRA